MGEATNDTTGASRGWIPMCEGAENLERNDPMAFFLATFGICSIGLNVFHVWIISSMPLLKKNSAYYHLLLHISFSDVANAFSDSLHLILNRVSYFENSTLSAVITYDIVSTGMYSTRYLIIAMACAEKYVALCHPLRHSTSIFIKKMHIWLPGCWLLSYGLVIIRDAVFHRSFCFDLLTGPWVRYGSSTTLITTSVDFISTLIIGILITRVITEMYRMGQRSLPQDQNEVKRAAQYVVIIIIVFYSCLIPGMIAFIIRFYTNVNLNTFWGFYVSVMLFHSLYGVLNTIIYGWYTQAYRRKVRMMISGKNIQVASIDNT